MSPIKKFKAACIHIICIFLIYKKPAAFQMEIHAAALINKCDNIFRSVS